MGLGTENRGISCYFEGIAREITLFASLSADRRSKYERFNNDGLVGSPISALRRILRHCGVGQLRLIPQDLQALILNILRTRRNADFQRSHFVGIAITC